MSDLPGSVSLREVGPRDGLQNEDPVPTGAKIELINALSQTGISRIEAVSFVRPEAIPQMADADQVWGGIKRTAAVRYSALAPNLRGARRALDSGFTEVEAVVSASDTHNRRNVNRGTGESLDDIAVIIAEAHARGASCQVVVATAWGCPYEGDVPVSRVLAVAGRAVADGADSVSFGDTTGMATPRRVTELVGEFRSAYPDTPLNLHFHNTRGTGLANVLAALELGVDDFDASVGGLGGCPYAPGATGNIATEEFVHMVEDMGVATGVDLEAMIGAAAEAERIIGRQLPSQVLRAGPAPARSPGNARPGPRLGSGGTLLAWLSSMKRGSWTPRTRNWPSCGRGSSGAAHPGTTSRPRRPASCSPGPGSPAWSMTAASPRTAGTPTRWRTACPRTG